MTKQKSNFRKSAEQKPQEEKSKDSSQKNDKTQMVPRDNEGREQVSSDWCLSLIDM